MAYRTDSGAIFAGLLGGDPAGQLDPFPSDDEDAPEYTADAIAVDDRGILFSYSRADGSVLRYDIQASSVRGRDPLEAEGLASPAITAAGESWAVVDAEDGDIWLRGADAATTAATTGTRRRRERRTRTARRLPRGRDRRSCGSPSTDRASTPSSAGGATVLGTPAQPIVHDGEVFAAWLALGR